MYVEIYAVTGELVKTKELIQRKTELELSALAGNNMYFYRILKNQQAMANGKFIKLK